MLRTLAAACEVAASSCAYHAHGHSSSLWGSRSDVFVVGETDCWHEDITTPGASEACIPGTGGRAGGRTKETWDSFDYPGAICSRTENCSTLAWPWGEGSLASSGKLSARGTLRNRFLPCPATAVTQRLAQFLSTSHG